MNDAVLLHTIFMKDALENEAVPMQDRFMMEQLVSKVLVNDPLLLHRMFVKDALEMRLYPCKTGL